MRPSRRCKLILEQVDIVTKMSRNLKNVEWTIFPFVERNDAKYPSVIFIIENLRF